MPRELDGVHAKFLHFLQLAFGEEAELPALGRPEYRSSAIVPGWHDSTSIHHSNECLSAAWA